MGGLVYFCLRQCASPAVKEQINDLLLRLLLYFGIDSHLAEHSRKLDGPAGKAAAGSTETATTRVEPSAVDAFLVRRRDGIELAPVQRQQLQRQAEQLRDIHSHFSSVALAVNSS